MARGRPSRATVYARLDSAIAELHGRLGGLPSPKESEYVWSDIWHLEAHHSTALEGNKLVLREVAELSGRCAVERQVCSVGLNATEMGGVRRPPPSLALIRPLLILRTVAGVLRNGSAVRCGATGGHAEPTGVLDGEIST